MIPVVETDAKQLADSADRRAESSARVYGGQTGGIQLCQRRELGRRIRLRHTPELTFHYDSGLDATDRVVELLARNPPILPEDPGEVEGS